METEIAKVDAERTTKAVAEFKPNPAFVSAGAMLPKSYKDVMDLSVIMAKSGIVPDKLIGKPEACAIAIMYGLELGLSPTQAVQNIMIVNGRPSLWGDSVKALVIGSGKCQEFDEDPPHLALQQGFGRCRLVRKAVYGGGTVEIVFSKEDAVRAKLWTKEGPWINYPGRMLMFRARGWACRDLFGDVLKGMQMREELEDYEIIHPAPPVKMPERVKRAETALEATIVTEPANAPVDPPNAAPAQSAAAPQASGEAEPAGDAQEPVTDPALRVTEDRRKDLFKLRTELKITMANSKIKLHKMGLEDTSEMTNAQADDYEAWLRRGGKD